VKGARVAAGFKGRAPRGGRRYETFIGLEECETYESVCGHGLMEVDSQVTI